MEDIELVVFDLAGTVIEDGGQVPEAFSTALRAHGIKITKDALRDVRGASKREVIGRFVREQLFEGKERAIILSEQIFDAFRSHLVKKYTDQGICIVPGAVDIFAWLHDNGIKVALNTGFDRIVTKIILGAQGWRKHTFDAVVCGDDVPRGRPAPYMIFRAMEAASATSVHRVACVGDTALDLQAGWNAGVNWNIGVLSGAHGREQLEHARHTHILQSVADLPSLWH